MTTKAFADAHPHENSCVDKQDHFVKSMSELVKIAIDNNDLRRQVAVHEGRLTAHESRIVVIEVSQVDNTADLHKILQHLESSLSVENQTKLLNYLEKAGKVQSFSNKWSPIACLALVTVILVTSKAEVIFEAFKKVFL